MENVYVVAIIAAAIVAAIVGVAWLLRDRITAGRFGASALDKKVEAEIKAAPPEKVRRRPLPPARGQRSSARWSASGATASILPATGWWANSATRSNRNRPGRPPGRLRNGVARSKMSQGRFEIHLYRP
jgi:hypothetical protein